MCGRPLQPRQARWVSPLMRFTKVITITITTTMKGRGTVLIMHFLAITARLFNLTLQVVSQGCTKVPAREVTREGAVSNYQSVNGIS